MRDEFPFALSDWIEEQPDRASMRLRAAIDKGCRMGSRSRASYAEKAEAFVQAGAWTEAALALLRFEVPEWHLRRLDLDRDEDEWCCLLSRHPAMPMEFDDLAEGRHRLLPLAILAAIDAGKRQPGAERVPAGQSSADGRYGQAVWCENFR